MNDLKYRPDIDGLRAIAVIGILLFHLDFRWVGGGYTGVDIFFVISGFLISRIIYSEAGQFSFARFYFRRVIRILPALLFTLTVSTVAALVLLYPPELVSFFKSLLASLFFSANIFFYKNLDYFAPPTTEIPLLHLWSLGVEEQFYIIFPMVVIFIMFIWKKSIVKFLFVVTTISFVLSVWMLSVTPSAAFYLIPFRAFEILIGSIIALPLVKSPEGILKITALQMAGFFSIAFCFFTYNKTTRFPGVAALLPCLGTALIIKAGGSQKGLVRKLLATRPLVYIGKISYSLYLVHWPIIVFGKRVFDDDADTFRLSVAALAASLILAYFVYHFVEQPFRKLKFITNYRTAFAYAATSIFILSVLSIYGIQQNGELIR